MPQKRRERSVSLNANVEWVNGAGTSIDEQDKFFVFPQISSRIVFALDRIFALTTSRPPPFNSSAAFWTFYVALVLGLWLGLSIIVPIGLAWTYVNLTHNAVRFFSRKLSEEPFATELERERGRDSGRTGFVVAKFSN